MGGVSISSSNSRKKANTLAKMSNYSNYLTKLDFADVAQCFLKKYGMGLSFKYFVSVVITAENYQDCSNVIQSHCM